MGARSMGTHMDITVEKRQGVFRRYCSCRRECSVLFFATCLPFRTQDELYRESRIIETKK